MTFKYKILAVDDNSISLATIEQALKEKYEVTPLNSAPMALQENLVILRWISTGPCATVAIRDVWRQ